ncbi:MAG: hypothetical protein N2Z84_04145 [Atribacterota bacterium]|nr:hypothetical protein [Atribacterota bacterium]
MASGGVLSRFYTDQEEAKEAMGLARGLLETVTQKITQEKGSVS